MNKQLFNIVIILTLLVSKGSGAAVTQPKAVLPPLEYYRPSDPCFNQLKGYTCNYRRFLTIHTLEVRKKKVKNKRFKEISNYLW